MHTFGTNSHHWSLLLSLFRGTPALLERGGNKFRIQYSQGYSCRYTTIHTYGILAIKNHMFFIFHEGIVFIYVTLTDATGISLLLQDDEIIIAMNCLQIA